MQLFKYKLNVNNDRGKVHSGKRSHFSFFLALKNISVIMNAPTVTVALIRGRNDYHWSVSVINPWLFEEVYSEVLIFHVHLNSSSIAKRKMDWNTISISFTSDLYSLNFIWLKIQFNFFYVFILFWVWALRW